MLSVRIVGGKVGVQGFPGRDRLNVGIGSVAAYTEDAEDLECGPCVQVSVLP